MTATPSATTQPAQSPTRVSRSTRRAPASAARSGAARSAVGTGHQTFLRALRSEWIKLRTLRSTWITSVLTLLLTTGTGAALAVAIASANEGVTEAWMILPAGTTFGQIVVAVLGALVITGEYSSGQMRSSLSAVPRRSRLYVAKALVIAFWSFLLGAVSIVLAWAMSAPFMKDSAISLTDERMLGFVWGSGLAFALLSVMSLGLGFLLRSTAGAITAVVVLLFVAQIPLALASVRFDWATKVAELLPSTTINAVIDPFSAQTAWAETAGSTMWLTHTQAVLAFVAWVVVPFVAGWVSFARRDA